MLDRDADAGAAGVDAFRVLGLRYDPDLTDADVRRAYLLRLRAVHPDNGGDAQAAAAVTAAYDALRSGGTARGTARSGHGGPGRYTGGCQHGPQARAWPAGG